MEKGLVAQVVVVAEWCAGRTPLAVQDMVVRMCQDVKVGLVDVRRHIDLVGTGKVGWMVH